MDHEKYMDLAIKQAKKALANNETPIGAVVVHKDGTILGRGYNKMEKIKCQTGHAEVVAIQKACKKIGDWRLNNCCIYVTLEPCTMCFGLIMLSRIDKLIFGAESPLFGYKNNKNIQIVKKDLVISEGIKKEECEKLLRRFFKKIRREKEYNEAKASVF